jgi:glycosyltransferase involved in cell wall biosynthesis
MKVLLIHNKYQQRGGEDAVFENETELLRKHGNIVETIIYNNNDIAHLSKVELAIKLFYNKDSYSELNAIFKKFEPEIIHVHNFFPLASPSIFFAAKKNKIPIVVTFHNFRLICSNGILFKDNNTCEKCVNSVFPLSGIVNKCYRNSIIQTSLLTSMTAFHKLIKTWNKKIDGYICLTEFSKNKLVNSSLKLDENKAYIKPNFSFEERIEVNKRENFYLFVGRLSEEKGIKTLLELGKKSEIKLKIAGTGEMQEEVLAACKEFTNIEFLGQRNKEELNKLYSKCKALIFPSTWYEGFPMTIVEALSNGTPVICSEIGGLPEIIIHNYNGLLFEPNNTDSLLSSILDFEENKIDFYANARKSYDDNFSSEKNYHALMSIYNKIITSKQ